jgi:hypothetical protein
MLGSGAAGRNDLDPQGLLSLLQAKGVLKLIAVL